MHASDEWRHPANESGGGGFRPSRFGWSGLVLRAIWVEQRAGRLDIGLDLQSVHLLFTGRSSSLTHNSLYIFIFPVHDVSMILFFDSIRCPRMRRTSRLKYDLQR